MQTETTNTTATATAVTCKSTKCIAGSVVNLASTHGTIFIGPPCITTDNEKNECTLIHVGRVLWGSRCMQHNIQQF